MTAKEAKAVALKDITAVAKIKGSAYNRNYVHVQKEVLTLCKS